MPFRQIKTPAIATAAVTNSKLDKTAITGQTAVTTLGSLTNDVLLAYDSSNDALRKITFENFITDSIDTDNLTEGSSKIFYTDARVQTFVSGGSLTSISTSGNATIGGNISVTGNLTVSGTTTTVNSNTLAIGDNIFVLNSDESGVPSQDGGMEVERGSSNNVRFIWNEAADRWSAQAYDGSSWGDADLRGDTITAATGFTGDLTGDVTGDLTGDVTGDVTGNLTGNSTGAHNGTVGATSPSTGAFTTASASGGFTGDLTGDVTGNADTATTLATARNFSMSSDVTAPAVSFDGSGNVNLVATLANSGVTAGSYGSATVIPVITVDAKGRITAVTGQNAGSALTISDGSGTDTVTVGTDTLTFEGGTGVTSTVSDNKVSLAIGQDVATTASPTFATITGTTFTDGTASFTAGAITGVTSISMTANLNINNNFTINATTGMATGDLTSDVTGNASTATALETARNLSLTGDATATLSGFDGSANVSASLTLANSGVTAGTVGSGTAIPVITVDAKGRITGTSTATPSVDISYAGDSGTDNLTTASETLTFAGGTGLTSAVTANQVAYSLDDTAVTAGSYGSSTLVPVITVDAQGRITAASTQAVATAFTISDGSSTDLVNGGETLTFTGGTGVTTTTGSNEMTFAIGQAVGTGDNVTFNNVTVDGTLTSDDITSTNVSIAGNATISGNLTVSGTTTTVNSTTTTVDDPVFTIGGDTAPASDDNLDRGIEFRWHDGSSAKIGFFGYDDSTSKFTFIQDATNNSEVFSGSAGNAAFGTIDGTTITASTGFTGNVTGNVTGDVTGDLTGASTGAHNGTVGATTPSTGAFTTASASGGFTGDLTGKADTADAWATARTFSFTGDVTGSLADVDGGGNESAALTIANSGVTAGSYGGATNVAAITVNAKGQITAASNTAIAISTTISDGSNTDTVALGTDTLTFAGGTGVTTTVSNNQVALAIGQAVGTTDNVSFGTVTANLTGDVTGDLTGDVTGDVTGDLTGDVTGTVSDISNHNLAGLGNVTNSSLAANQVLEYNGSAWVNNTKYFNVVDLADVDDSSLSGKGDYLLQVKQDASGFELVDPATVAFGAQNRVTLNGDGSATTFNLGFTPNSGTMVFVGGVIQDVTTHYTLDTSNDQITFTDTMPTGTSAVVISTDSSSVPYVPNNGVTTDTITNAAVTGAKIAGDAIDGSKVADDAINSEHIADGAIDTAHIADSNITTAKVANNAITSAKLATNIDIAGTFDVTSTATFDANVTIGGNLTVSGTTTTVNSTELNIGDNQIVLNSDETGAPSQNAGIEIERGTSTNVSFIWNESDDNWTTGTDTMKTGHMLPAADVTYDLGSDSLQWRDLYLSGSTIKLGGAEISASGSNISLGGSGAYVGNLTGDVTGDISGATGTFTGTVTADKVLFKNMYANESDLPNATTYHGMFAHVHATGAAYFAHGGNWVKLANHDIALKSNENDTASGIITFSNTTNSTSSSTGAVIVSGGIGVGGNIYADGDVTAYSDDRLKTNIETIDNGLDKVMALRGITFERIKDGSVSTGVSAQELEAVLPEAVTTDENGLKAVKYGNLVGLLIEAVKDLKSEVEELKTVH